MMNKTIIGAVVLFSCFAIAAPTKSDISELSRLMQERSQWVYLPDDKTIKLCFDVLDTIETLCATSPDGYDVIKNDDNR